MQLDIENGIPEPTESESRPTAGKGYRATLLKLKPGQSVLLPTTRASAYSTCYALYSDRRVPPGSFVMRTEDNGVRVWRKATSTYL